MLFNEIQCYYKLNLKWDLIDNKKNELLKTSEFYEFKKNICLQIGNFQTLKVNI